MKRRLISLLSVIALFIASFSAICIFAYAEDILQGDINYDTHIDMKDVLALRKYIAYNSGDIQIEAADVNGDRTVDMKDVLAIRKYIAHYDITFSTAGPEPFFAMKTDPQNGSFGTWWWNGTNITDEVTVNSKLTFLQNNHCTEIWIWFNPSKTTKEQMASFVRNCGSRGMRVAWLSGDVSWILPGNTGFDKIYNQFLEYQNWAPDDAKLYGLHLDVEPHQNAQLDNDTKWQYYADLANYVCNKVHSDGYEIEWDIPFWTDDLMVDFGNQMNVHLTKALMEASDTVTLMSYRDTGKAILSTGTYEVSLANETNCKVIFGAEIAKSSEGENVSFYEEGKVVLYNELAAVLTELSKKNLSAGYGIAVHYIDTWMTLQDGEGTVTTTQGDNTTQTTQIVTTSTTRTGTTTSMNSSNIENRSAYSYGSDGVPYQTFQDPVSDNTTLGTWWWYNDQGFDASIREGFLDFLEKNKCTEIYFYGYDFLTGTSNQKKLHEFVQAAMNHGMGVAIINEDVGITRSGNQVMKSIVSNYLSYVNAYPDDNMLGIHFDVEHVSVEEFAYNMVSQFDYARENGVPIAMDVNCEMDIETQLTVGGVTGNIYEVIAAHTTTLTLMSYRDTYETIMELGDAAYKAALKYNCKVVFAVETGRYSFNPETWEFYQESKEFMYEEVQKVYLDLVHNHPSAGYGIAIHNHETWQELKTL